jgi:hypothetical protein
MAAAEITSVNDRVVAFILRVTKRYDAGTLAEFRTAEQARIDLPQSAMKSLTSSEREITRHVKRFTAITASLPATTAMSTLRTSEQLHSLLAGSGMVLRGRQAGTSERGVLATGNIKAAQSTADKLSAILALTADADANMTIAEFRAALAARKLAEHEELQRQARAVDYALAAAIPGIAI